MNHRELKDCVICKKEFRGGGTSQCCSLHCIRIKLGLFKPSRYQSKRIPKINKGTKRIIDACQKVLPDIKGFMVAVRWNKHKRYNKAQITIILNDSFYSSLINGNQNFLRDLRNEKYEDIAKTIN